MSEHLRASVSHISMLQRPFGPRFLMDEFASSAAPSGGGDTGGSVPESFSSADAAARFLISSRDKRDSAGGDAGTEHSSESADPATGDTELSDEGNAAPGEDPAPGENADADPEAEQLPSIERPRSWAKEDQAEWDDLPRSQQEKIAARENTREKAIRTAQNEAAEKLKGLTAKEQAAEQARTQYESQTKAALAILEREQASRFPDIRTTADVAKLAEHDPLRYLQWKAHQDELAWASAENQKAEDRAAKSKADDWNSFRAKENAAVLEHIPDLGDAEKAPKLMQRAVSHLQGLGFSAEELGSLDKGEKLSLFDHRVQRLIFDAMRYQDVQKAGKAAVVKPVPPVQRPGTKPPSGQANSERIQTLTSKLTNTGSLRDAAALLIAKRGARR